MTVALGADHRGFPIKIEIKRYLRGRHIRIMDCGADTPEPVDYPIIARAVAEAVARRRARFGILLCYTGNGMAIAANKVKDARAAVALTPVFAHYARLHNDANILVIPAGFTPTNKIKIIISEFLKTKFEGGRHRRRVNLIRRYEKAHCR